MTTGIDGSIYVGGRTASSFDGQTNNGVSDGFLAKYDTEGNKQWTKFIGGSGFDFIVAMTLGRDGSIYVGGRTTSSFDGQTNNGATDGFLAKYDTEGNKQWTKFIGGSGNENILAIATDLNGFIYAGGYTYSSTLDGQTVDGNGLLAKYDSDGNKQWTKFIGGTAGADVLGISTSAYEKFYVAGRSSASIIEGQTNASSAGTNDGFITRFSSV